MLFVGVAAGLVMLLITLWLNILAINRSKNMPPRPGSKHIVFSYLCKMAGFLIILGIAFRYGGIDLIFGILLGMVLGFIVFLFIGRKNRVVLERLFRPHEKQG